MSATETPPDQASDPPPTDPVQLRAWLTRRAVLAARAQLAARAGAVPALEAAQITAHFRAGLAARGEALAPLPLPLAARRAIAPAAPLPIDNAVIHAADLRRLRHRPDTGGFLQRVRAATRRRTIGDPHAGTLAQAAQSIVYFLDKQGVGYARATFAALATATGYCLETCRKAVRWLQAHGLLDVVNVLSRRVTADGYRRLVRDANLYLLRDDPAAGQDAARGRPADRPHDPPPPSPAAGVVARWGGLLAVAVRAIGRPPVAARGSG